MGGFERFAGWNRPWAAALCFPHGRATPYFCGHGGSGGFCLEKPMPNLMTALIGNGPTFILILRMSFCGGIFGGFVFERSQAAARCRFGWPTSFRTARSMLWN